MSKKGEITIMKPVRHALIAARKSVPGLTQEHVAKEVGIDRTAYTRIERGIRNVSVEEAIIIARVVGKKIEEIFLPNNVNDNHKTGTENS